MFPLSGITRKASFSDVNILGTSGVIVTLPITKDEGDTKYADKIFRKVLRQLANDGVKSTAIEGGNSSYDDIILSLSGFYILPFLLPQFLRQCKKRLNQQIELLIIDEMTDLTLDILCIVSNEVDRITILTEQTDLFENAAYKFYIDSGLNIFVTNSGENANMGNVILSASFNPLENIDKFAGNSIYMDMVGSNNASAALEAKRRDIIVADGFELKIDDKYIDNILLETILYANNNQLKAYISGNYDNDEFYGVFDMVQSIQPRITAFRKRKKPDTD